MKVLLSSEGLRGLADGVWSRSRPRRWAAVVSIVWIVLVLFYVIGFLRQASAARGTVFLDGLFFLLTLALPLILIWLAAYLAEELERQREVIAALAEIVPPLLGGLEATRDALERHGPASPLEIQKAVQGALLGGRGPDLAAPIERVLSGQAELRAGINALLARPVQAAAPPPELPASRPAPVRKRRAADRPDPEPAQAQAALPLLPGATEPEWADLIRALDFPRDAEDRAGFRALKTALRHRSLAQMLQAAEDVLNLLSQEGVYMDDLEVTPGAPAAWRRFIEGVRGPEVAEVGGIADPRALDLARALMKSDPIFRDTALYFLRRFDVVLHEFGAGADDARLLEMADTRSGRAFMLLTRMSGSFE